MKKNKISTIKGVFNLNGPIISIFNKSLFITKREVNKILLIYNGKKFLKLKISQDMVGYRLGSFVFTKIKHVFIKKKKKK